MSDLISRQAAIDAVNSRKTAEQSSAGIMRNAVVDFCVDIIKKLPPAQPKRGRWIKLDMHRGMADHKCTACEQECYVPTCMGEPMYAYCPNCGAKMEVNNESD